jgi:hypothetical protein
MTTLFVLDRADRRDGEPLPSGGFNTALKLVEEACPS